MAWFKRKPEQKKVVTVLDPSTAERLDEAVARLEDIAAQLLRRLDEFAPREPVAPVRARKAPAKKSPAKKASPRKKES